MSDGFDPTTLRAGADLYRAIFETSLDAILVVDADGRVQMANARASRLFGYGDGDLRGMQIEQFVPERYRTVHKEHRGAFALRPHGRAMGSALALFALRRDGSEFPVDIALHPLERDGAVMYVASVRDVSELARTRQAALRGRYSAFVARFGMAALAEPNFEQLLNAVPPLITEAMEVDAALVFRLSPDASELFCAAFAGVPHDLGARLTIPNDPRYFAGYLVAARGAVTTTDARAETRYEVPAEVARLGFLSVAGVPLFDRDRVIGVLTVRGRHPREFTDDDVNFLQAIANILATALQRSTAEEHLLHVQRLDALGQLTGGVAHDFNNLLMVISGNLQVLEESLRPGSAEIELTRAATAAADRGAMLTRKLLAFARKQPLHPRLFDLGQLLRDFRDLVQRTLGENVAVRLALDPDVPLLFADPGQLEAALLNLAVNARDAMPTGGRITIQTECALIDSTRIGDDPELAPGSYACISVTDSGSGMPPEVLERAFEPFYTTKEAGKGSGLGLSMVYGFVRQSGGAAHIYSEHGRGTTVRLYLPLPPEAQSEDAPAPRREIPKGAESVLVVEDEADVRRIAVMFLSRLGYRVHQASDAETALAMLEASDLAIDLLFTDMVLPGMNGAELAQRAQAMRPGLAVLYTSGYASASVLERLPPRDSESLISKPYRREDLAHAVRRALRARAGQA